SFAGTKSDGTVGMEGAAASAYRNRIMLDIKMSKDFALSDHYVIHGRNVNLAFGENAVGADRVVGCSLLSSFNQDLGRGTTPNTEYTSRFYDGDMRNLKCENGLFSSSFSDLFCRNLKLSSNNNAGYSGHSVAATAAVNSEDECFESLEELEARTICNLLPDDDDLLSGVTDGFESITRLNNVEEIEEFDLFSSVGGLELGEDGFAQRNTELSDVNSNNRLSTNLGGEHPRGEHPSRTLFVRNINSNVEDSELTTLFEQYGDIRTLYTACKHRGFVMISYHDIRAACNAMKALQNKPLRRRKLDIHFSIPKENTSDKDINQGTLAIFNLDSSVSNDDVLRIFGVYGEIKGIHEATDRSHHRFVEFYDIRSAESALHALNRSEIAGKRIRLEPGGSKRSISQSLFIFLFPSAELEREDSGMLLQPPSSSNNSAVVFPGSLSSVSTASGIDNGTKLGAHSANGGSSFVDHVLQNGVVSSSASNSLPSFLRVENMSGITDSSSHRQSHLKFEIHGTPNSHTHSLPEYHNAPSNGLQFGSPGSVSEVIDSQQFHRFVPARQPLGLTEVFGSSGHRQMWSHSPQAVLWPRSQSFVNGIGALPPQQLRAVPGAPPHMHNSVLPLSHHHAHVGSAPSVDPTIWDRCRIYAGDSLDAGGVFHPGSLGNARISGNSPHPVEFVPHHILPGAGAGANCMDMPIPSKATGLHPPHHQRCMMFPTRAQLLSTFDSPNERSRNRRNESNLGQPDNKKQFELDIDRILRGEDKRTTLMIKNIPNKYTSKMLLASIDERHKGTYDFIYLPIDFKASSQLGSSSNKCNVGYAFINMTHASLIPPFYQTFNGKKWEKFNSEKVASLAYARIQGKAALIAHFQNSSLMNEDKRCRPILFHTDGPNAGDQV
ncbi:hypothetical protein M569_01535, partial [Genlisea aurea]